MNLLAENGRYVTAEGGGGINGANNALVLTARAVSPGPWETFSKIDNGDSTFSLKTNSGNYITAQNGGGTYLSTDAVNIGDWEKFTSDSKGLIITKNGFTFKLVDGPSNIPVVYATGNLNGMRFRGLNSLPPIPSRDTILKVKYAFQGLTVNTPSYGKLPWWETLAWLLNANDRQAAYSAKLDNGDTHFIFDITGAYREPGQIYYDLNLGHDWTNNLEGAKQLVIEGLEQGFIGCDLRLGGDAQSINDNPQYGQYNDPVGWTYGFQWLMNNLPRIWDVFKDLNDYLIFTPGYDAVFYGWSPEQVVAFSTLARNLGIKYLALETDKVPLGEGGGDFASNGRMSKFDLIYGEFDNFIPGPPLNTLIRINPDGTYEYVGNGIWQKVARLVNNYVWPPDEPLNADRNPPPSYVAGQVNAYGFPYIYNIMEFGTFQWVRNNVTRDQIMQQTNYYRQLSPGIMVCV